MAEPIKCYDHNNLEFVVVDGYTLPRQPGCPYDFAICCLGSSCAVIEKSSGFRFGGKFDDPNEAILDFLRRLPTVSPGLLKSSIESAIKERGGTDNAEG